MTPEEVRLDLTAAAEFFVADPGRHGAASQRSLRRTRRRRLGLRATFLIDPDGILRHATVADQSVGRSADETLRLLQALRTGALCPVGWRKGQPTLETA